MADASFLPYRDLPGPATPEGREDFDPRAARRRWLREGEPREDGEYVLYWMQMFRRTRSNAALDEAVRLANRLERPLVVYEGLNPDYPGACDRHHRFLLGCARETARALGERGVRYVFHLRRTRNEDRAAAVEMIAEAAAAVVDDFPAFILPGVTRAALERTRSSGTPVLAVDDNGVVPLAEIEGRQYAARTIRPRLHRLLPAYLHPLAEHSPEVRRPGVSVPAEGLGPELAEASDADLDALVASCEVDHDVPPSPRFPAGREAALERLERFLAEGLPRYADASSDPGAGATSDLSPYLHFGCLSSREAALRALAADAPEEAVDAWLEQLVVRRELAYNFCWSTPLEDHTSLDALPDWARETMAEHADDERPVTYDRATFERAATEDELWNAAQRELLHTGTIHNYMRMLWGKKVLEWSADYGSALETMLDLHHRYALDGRNPNTYANVLWCFGLHDRAFGERAVFGKLRPMTSASTRRKHDVDSYMQRVDEWQERAEQQRLERD